MPALQEYTPIAFDENGNPIAPPSGGSFDFSRYDIPTRNEAPQATIVQESFDPYQRQIDQEQFQQQEAEQFKIRNPTTESSMTLQMGQPAPVESDFAGLINTKAAQFKGMDMYRKLRTGGATHEEAIMRAAPLLYANSPSGFTKAVTPQIPVTAPHSVPQYDADGNLLGYSLVDSSGKQKSFVKQPVASEKLGVADSVNKQNLMAERQSLNQQLNAIVRNPLSAFDPKSQTKVQELQTKIEDNISKVEAIANKYSKDRGAGADSGPTADATVKVQEVIRRDKSGRRAVFDASTKEFIRYAN